MHNIGAVTEGAVQIFKLSQGEYVAVEVSHRSPPSTCNREGHQLTLDKWEAALQVGSFGMRNDNKLTEVGSLVLR